MPGFVQKNRFLSLDYLRGFFIIVIIIDHLSRWPSLWIVLTGKALQWVTAAEGFVIISGLLVGYIRGYKNKDEPFKKIATILIRRGILLYMWSVIATVAYSAIIWYVPLQGGAPSVPYPTGDWATLIHDTILLQYTNVWVYFLFLYAVFLIASPIAIWLFRQRAAWLAVLISIFVFIVGTITHDKAMQWQILFFIPATVGFYLPTILAWWSRIDSRQRRLVKSWTVGATLITMIISVITVFFPVLLPHVSSITNMLFDKDTMSFARVIMAFLWFTGLFFIFKKFEGRIAKRLGWLLEPIGTKSLTAYIIHGAILCVLSFFTVDTESLIINSLIALVAILLVWSIVRTRHVNKLIPR